MRRDQVTEKVYRHVRSRDGWRCIGPAVGMPGVCDGRVELDHIRNGGGIGLRGPSTPENLASLCEFVHHPLKTAASSKWGPLLTAFVARLEGVK